MSSLLRIRQLYPEMTLNERRLADYLLSQPQAAAQISSQQLASQSGVSQSAVVKFAQKLGYKGFPALRLALNDALKDRENQPQSQHHHALKTLGETLLSQKQSAIRATFDINTEQMLLETLHILNNAGRIVLIGVGASGLVAKDFCWKLMKMGISAVAEQDMHALLASVRALEPGDVLLAISYSGERRELNLAAEEARRIGATVLAFTGFTPNTLQQSATRSLYTVAQEQDNGCPAIAITTAQLALTDLLYMALIQQDHDRATRFIDHSEALVKKLV